MHTDTYGDFRNPPMQGPFTEAMVGGTFFRHQSIIDEPGETPECPPGTVYGCTDPAALNYWHCATDDDGSCIFPIDVLDL